MEKATGVSYQNVSILKARLLTKKDQNLFLCYELDSYLSEQHCISVFFMKDIINDSKKVKFPAPNFNFSTSKMQMQDICTPLLRSLNAR